MKKLSYAIILILCFSLFNMHGGHIDENEIQETNLSKLLVSKLEGYSKLTQANIGAFIVSSASIPIFFIILLFRIRSEGVLSIFSAFASGALLGDVFIHNLPEIFPSEHRHEHHHEHHHEHEHHHHDKSGFQLLMDKDFMLENFFKNEMLICWGVLLLFIVEKVMSYLNTRKEGEKIEDHKHEHGHGHSHDEMNTTNGTIYLLGDFIHNLTDGMAIGAGFNKSLKLGITLSLSIFFHEMPHEVGDFSYLLKQNVPIWYTLFSQIITAIGAFIGVYLSFILGEKYSDKIISFASGAFIYLAVNTIMGDLKNTNRIYNILLEAIAFIVGVFVLDLVI